MNNLKQQIFKYITNPVAKLVNYLNFPKRNKIKKMQKAIALDNKLEYLATTTKILLEKDLMEHAEQGLFPNPMTFPILVAKHIEMAEKMFDEKKKNGDFDELNLMLK